MDNRIVLELSRIQTGLGRVCLPTSPSHVIGFTLDVYGNSHGLESILKGAMRVGCTDVDSSSSTRVNPIVANG